MGVVFSPKTRELYLAMTGKGSYRNGQCIFSTPGNDGADGDDGGALVSTTVWVSSVTARSPARLRTAVVRVFEIMLTSTLPAWACKALLWTCRAV